MKHRHVIAIIIAFLLFQGCQREIGVPKHVFFIVIDSLRADHLGCYGYKVPTSPTIDRLAKEGIVFKNAYSTASNTLESVFSFFLGTTSLTHKVNTLYWVGTQSLSSTSLHTYLRQAGYNTLAVVSNPWLKYHQNYFRDGFTHFQFVPARHDKSQKEPGNTTELVTQAVTNSLETAFDTTGKNFFYIHYLDPHCPYQPAVDYNFFSGEAAVGPIVKKGDVYALTGEREIRTKYKQDHTFSGLPTPIPLPENDVNYLVSLYDSEIRYVDAQIEKLLHTLELMNILDDSLIIITSDHGEEFLEHGCFHHGCQLYDETIHIPLILYWKDHLDNETRKTIVSGIDIAPTILDFLQLKIPSTMLGTSLLRKTTDEAILFCTHFINQWQRGMRMGRWKLIENAHTGEIKIFDIKKDPGEQKNLFADALKEREQILQTYKNTLARHTVETDETTDKKSQEPPVMDDATKQQLEALGYL